MSTHASRATDAVPAAVATCLDAYGLGPAREVTLLGGGFVGRTWLARLPGRAVVVKHHNPRFSEQRIRAACLAQRHVARHCGLAPPVLASGSGDVVTTVDGQLFSVSGFAYRLAGAPGSWNPTLFAALGTFLATLHRCLDHFFHPAPIGGFLTLPADPVADLHRVGKTLREDPVVAGEIRRRTHMLDTLAAEAPQPWFGLPVEWVHGDVRPANLLFDPNRERPAAIIDFDQVSRFPRGYEAMRAFWHALAPTQPQDRVCAQFHAYLTSYLTRADPAPSWRWRWRSVVDLYLWTQAAETRTYTDTDDQVANVRAFARTRMGRLERAWATRAALRHTLHTVLDDLESR